MNTDKVFSLYTGIEFREEKGQIIELPDTTKSNALMNKAYFTYRKIFCNNYDHAKAYAIMRRYLTGAKKTEADLQNEINKEKLLEGFFDPLERRMLNGNLLETDSKDPFVDVRLQYAMKNFYPQLLIKCFYIKYNYEKYLGEGNKEQLYKYRGGDVGIKLKEKFNINMLKLKDLKGILMAGETDFLTEGTDNKGEELSVLWCYEPKIETNTIVPTDDQIERVFIKDSHTNIANKGIFMMLGKIGTKSYADHWEIHERIQKVEKYRFKPEEEKS